MSPRNRAAVRTWSVTKRLSGARRGVARLRITPHELYGDWNYTIEPH